MSSWMSEPLELKGRCPPCNLELLPLTHNPRLSSWSYQQCQPYSSMARSSDPVQFLFPN